MSKNPKNIYPGDRYSGTDCPDPKYPDDDGRVVADMSQVVRVHMMDLIAPEGLRKRLGGRRPGHSGSDQDRNPYGQSPYSQNPYGQNPYGQSPYGQNPYGNGEPLELTDGELKALMKASLKAAMLLAGVFILAAALLILFTVFIWFR